MGFPTRKVTCFRFEGDLVVNNEFLTDLIKSNFVLRYFLVQKKGYFLLFLSLYLIL